MSDKTATDWSELVEIVEDNLDDFVDELRAIEAIDLISFIRMEHYPNLEDLINSSTELFFRSGMLVFGWAAAVDLRWDARPLVTLGLEFRHPALTLFFNLSLGAVESAVEVLGLAFEEECADPAAALRRAFGEARLGSHRNPVTLAFRNRRGLPGAPSRA